MANSADIQRQNSHPTTTTEYEKEIFLTLFDEAGITLKTKLDKDNLQKEH